MSNLDVGTAKLSYRLFGEEKANFVGKGNPYEKEE